DDRSVLLLPVEVTGHDSGSDVYIGAHLRIPDIAEVVHASARPDRRSLDLGVRADLGSGPDLGAAADMRVRSDPHVILDGGVTNSGGEDGTAPADTRGDDVTARPDLALPSYICGAANDGAGEDDRVRLDLDLVVNKGRGAIHDGDATLHQAPVGAR